MPRLFVANCTRQFQEIYYRLDFNDKGNPETNARFQPAKKQTIPPGRQINLGGDLHSTQIVDIIDQLKRFGLAGTVDVPNLKRATPYIFDIDHLIKPDVIRQVMDMNSGILVDQGKKRRQKAAIVVNETVANAVANEFAAAGIPKEPQQQVEVEFDQEQQSEAGERRIEEGYRMSSAAPAPGAGSVGKGSRRNKRS